MFKYFLTFSLLLLVLPQISASNDFWERRNAARDRFWEDRNTERDRFWQERNAAIKAQWANLRTISGTSLPDLPDSQKIKIVEISEIKTGENPDIEIMNILVGKGVNKERAADIALEIIDSVGVDAIREGQIIVSVDTAIALLQPQDDNFVSIESKGRFQTAPHSTNLKYMFPLKVPYRKTSDFGKRIDPITKEKGVQHNGVDYAAPRGSGVYAIANGTVIESAFNNINGNYVVIKHEDGILSYYLHLNEKGIANGRVVKAGDRIGRIGSTGRSTGPHLHLGIKKNGVWQSPEKLFRN